MISGLASQEPGQILIQESTTTSTLSIDHRHHNTTTEEPRFNGVPRDWENVFVISWVGYIENLDLTNF